jgi:hypothetical protein
MAIPKSKDAFVVSEHGQSAWVTLVPTLIYCSIVVSDVTRLIHLSPHSTVCCRTCVLDQYNVLNA